MQRRPPRFLTVALIAVTLLLTACGEAEQSTVVQEERSGESLEPATPRGLAAGVISHLPAGSVVSASGSDENEQRLAVIIETSDQAIDSVYLEVQQPSQHSVQECGGDSGYQRVSCEKEPHFFEVASRKADKGSGPELIGRYYDESRGCSAHRALGFSGCHGAATRSRHVE